MQTFSNASSSEMLTRVRLTDGSMECFRPFDESQALQIWRGVDPIHLFAQPRLVIAGPNSKSVFVCAEINRIDFIRNAHNCWEFPEGFSDIVELSESEFKDRVHFEDAERMPKREEARLAGVVYCPEGPQRALGVCDGGDFGQIAGREFFFHALSAFWNRIPHADSRRRGLSREPCKSCQLHCVSWIAKDLVQSATALQATGQTATPVRALIWLASLQRQDASFPQNSWIDGTAYWSGIQLDQAAAPILLAWRLHKHNAILKDFDPSVMIMRAAAYLILHGPVTSQERWEENAGFSPSTLAPIIASLVCVAECGRERGESSLAEFVLEYADSLDGQREKSLTSAKGAHFLLFDLN